jgi:ADP-heptose:LPS heptosyltransferase
VADYLVESLAPLDAVGPEVAVPRVTLDPTALAEVRAWLARKGDVGQRWAAYHPGSGSPRKNWPVANFATVAADLASYGLRPVLLAGPAEADTFEAAELTLGPLRPLVARDWPLPRLAALLHLCAGYVGVDSGITHLAAAAGARVVAVFGPTDPRRWAPRGPRVSIVRCPEAGEPGQEPLGVSSAYPYSLGRLAPDAVLAAALRCFGLVAEAPEASGRRARTRGSVLHAPTLQDGANVTSCSNPR